MICDGHEECKAVDCNHKKPQHEYKDGCKNKCGRSGGIVNSKCIEYQNPPSFKNELDKIFEDF